MAGSKVSTERFDGFGVSVLSFDRHPDIGEDLEGGCR